MTFKIECTVGKKTAICFIAYDSLKALNQLFVAKNIWAWPAGIQVVDEFFLGRFDLGPVVGPDADDSSGTESFQDEIHRKCDLNAATAERRLLAGLAD